MSFARVRALVVVGVLAAIALVFVVVTLVRDTQGGRDTAEECPAGYKLADARLRLPKDIKINVFNATSTAGLAGRWLRGRVRIPRRRPGRPDPRELEKAYCAEIVAATYQAMDLLPTERSPNWYDPGRFWSGDDLALSGGYALGGEIAVDVPPSDPQNT